MREKRIAVADWRLIAAAMVFIWVGCAAFVALEQLSGHLTLRDFSVDPLSRIRFLTRWYWLPWLIFAPCVAMLSWRLPIRPERWLGPIAAHLLLLAAIVSLHSLGFAYAYHYSRFITPDMATFEPWQHSGHFLFGDDGLLFIVIFYFVIAGTVNFRGFLETVRGQEKRTGDLQRSIIETKLHALRMQINPHFLFNVLNSIVVLVRKGAAAEAIETLARLSGLLRRTLDTSTQQWISLERELDFIEQYVGIARIRFGDRLAAEVHCDSSLFAAQVPSMILQPLVENALTHGLSGSAGNAQFSLRCARTADGGVHIEIRDNGVGGRFYGDENFVEGVGLRNVRERLEQTFGDAHQFSIEGEPGHGTTVTLHMPIIDAGSAELAA